MLPQLIVLLGPIAVGKSTVGRLLENRFRSRFLSPEEFFLRHYGTVENYRNHRDSAYKCFELEVRQVLANASCPVIVEEIGLTVPARHLLQRLRADYVTLFVGVDADEQTCLSRLAERGTEQNFPATPSMLIASRLRFETEVLPHFDLAFTVRNENAQDINLTSPFSHLLQRRSSNSQ